MACSGTAVLFSLRFVLSVRTTRDCVARRAHVRWTADYGAILKSKAYTIIVIFSPHLRLGLAVTPSGLVSTDRGSPQSHQKGGANGASAQLREDRTE